MKIENYITDNGKLANRLELETSFYYLSQWFNIIAYFYNDEVLVSVKEIDITPKEVDVWMDMAKQYPEKATFLNFSLITQWFCETYNVTIIDLEI
jgi:hypothetical protein